MSAASAPRCACGARVSRRGRRCRPCANSAWDSEEILAALVQWAREHGRSPSKLQWAREGDGPSVVTVCVRFGSWSDALRAAGLTPNVGRGNPKWTEERIVEALRLWASQHDRPPTVSEWWTATPARPGYSSVVRRFGSWRKGLQAAGLPALLVRCGCGRDYLTLPLDHECEHPVSA